MHGRNDKKKASDFPPADIRLLSCYPDIIQKSWVHPEISGKWPESGLGPQFLSFCQLILSEHTAESLMRVQYPRRVSGPYCTFYPDLTMVNPAYSVIDLVHKSNFWGFLRKYLELKGETFTEF